MEIFAILSYLKSSTHISIPIMLKFCQGLKYLKMSTIHTERDDGGAEGPERGTEARSAGVPRGVGSGRGAVTPPQYGCLEASPSENFEI